MILGENEIQKLLSSLRNDSIIKRLEVAEYVKQHLSDPCEIEKYTKLGQGTEAEVYQTTIKYPVAIKLLTYGQLSNEIVAFDIVEKIVKSNLSPHFTIPYIMKKCGDDKGVIARERFDFTYHERVDHFGIKKNKELSLLIQAIMGIYAFKMFGMTIQDISPNNIGIMIVPRKIVSYVVKDKVYTMDNQGLLLQFFDFGGSYKDEASLDDINNVLSIFSTSLGYDWIYEWRNSLYRVEYYPINQMENDMKRYISIPSISEYPDETFVL